MGKIMSKFEREKIYEAHTKSRENMDAKVRKNTFFTFFALMVESSTAFNPTADASKASP